MQEIKKYIGTYFFTDQSIYEGEMKLSVFEGKGKKKWS